MKYLKVLVPNHLYMCNQLLLVNNMSYYNSGQDCKALKSVQIVKGRYDRDSRYHFEEDVNYIYWQLVKISIESKALFSG